jgi:hypothetical protein
LRIRGPSRPAPSVTKGSRAGNPKQMGGRSVRGEPRNCCRDLVSETLARNRFHTATVRAISRVVRQAFLGAPGASITGGRACEARPLTMKRCAALFHWGVRAVSATPFLI